MIMELYNIKYKQQYTLQQQQEGIVSTLKTWTQQKQAYIAITVNSHYKHLEPMHKVITPTHS